MRLLLDTHFLLWAANDPDRLPRSVAEDIDRPGSVPLFSTMSIWEIAIKSALRRFDFGHDARAIRAAALNAGYEELHFNGEHAVVAGALPPHHSDPFDRALIAQARVEAIDLLTGDRRLRDYGAPVRIA